jgi:flagellar motor protein MotB
VTEGRGDAEPLGPNDSNAGRAKNRRVAILLKPAN